MNIFSLIIKKEFGGMMHQDNHYNIIVVGGGCAGLTVATRLYKLDKNLKIGVIDPSDTQNYQAAWTLVGAGSYKRSDTQRSMNDVFPKYLSRIKAFAQEFFPEKNTIKTNEGEYTYDQLVVCPGLKVDFAGIEGLEKSLGKNNVCTNYSADMAEYTWKSLQSVNAGSNVFFTEPGMPIKCAGAPQKIMYLASDYFRKKGQLTDVNVEYFCAKPVIFGVAYFQKPLEDICDYYGAQRNYQHNLIAIDGDSKEATFKIIKEGAENKEVTKKFDFIHITPPQTAPDFIKNSPLADDAGWVSVDQGTLKHTKYDNIYSLGDVMNAPNAKTGAAIRKQAPIVAHNLISDRQKKSDYKRYDGYGACPLTVEYGKVMLAEFCYGGKVSPSFPLDPRVPRSSYWWLKKNIFPFLQWNVMFKGQDWNFPVHKPLAT